MRRAVFGVVALAVVGSFTLAASAAAGTRAYLAPGSGNPTTTFVLRFRAPDRTGSLGTLRRVYQLQTDGPEGTGCVSSVSIWLRPSQRHAHLRVTLNPKRLGGTWCAGRFHGRIQEVTTILCPRLRACPDIVIAPRTITRFSFRVNPVPVGTPGGPPTTGPTFAGLQSATTCSPGPINVVPKERIFTLTWSAATDPVTPSSEIVYDIYYATTPGGENFSTPSWTTQAGATTDSVGGAGAYFVVRARDQAGLEDHNTVERAAVNMCL
ncbi:MAG: hypothetical protein ACR2MK_04410 [Solirubrobacteraceae bacterium]